MTLCYSPRRLEGSESIVADTVIRHEAQASHVIDQRKDYGKDYGKKFQIRDRSRDVLRESYAPRQ